MTNNISLIITISSAVAIGLYLKQASHVSVSPLVWLGSFACLLLVAHALRAVLSLYEGTLLKVDRSYTWRAFVCMLVSTLLLIGVMSYMDDKIKTKELPLGVVTFEFGMTNQGMQRIKSAWTREQELWVAFLQGTDHLFMLLYSNTLAMGCFFVGHGSELSFDLAALQYIAAICDVFEGIFLHQVLLAKDVNSLDERMPLGAAMTATIKFCLILSGLLYFTVASVLSLCASKAQSKMQ